MTLGNAAAARVRLIVWCKACGRRVEPDAAEMAERYGADSAVPEWRERLVCSRCGSRNVEHRGDRDRAAVALTAPPHLNLPADRSRPLRAIPAMPADGRGDRKADIHWPRPLAPDRPAHAQARFVAVAVFSGNRWAVRLTPGRLQHYVVDGDGLAQAFQRHVTDLFQPYGIFDRVRETAADQDLSILGFAHSRAARLVTVPIAV